MRACVGSFCRVHVFREAIRRGCVERYKCGAFFACTCMLVRGFSYLRMGVLCVPTPHPLCFTPISTAPPLGCMPKGYGVTRYVWNGGICVRGRCAVGLTRPRPLCVCLCVCVCGWVGVYTPPPLRTPLCFTRKITPRIRKCKWHVSIRGICGCG